MRIVGENGKISLQMNISFYRVCVQVLVLFFPMFFISASHASLRLHLLTYELLSLSLPLSLSLSLSLTLSLSLSLSHSLSSSLPLFPGRSM